MCGRYSITIPPEAMRRLFKFTGPLPNLPPRYNVAPKQRVPIVRRARGDARRELVQVRWGLTPLLCQGRRKRTRLINARAEGIIERPGFRAAVKSRRCLVPADGFYEWQATLGRKVPWRITLIDERPFAFAGLWDRWEMALDAAPIETCTIITTSANRLLRPLHDRMPVILAADDYAAWLGEDAPRDVAALLRTYPPEEMKAYRVCTAVNSVRNDGPECVEPLD